MTQVALIGFGEAGQTFAEAGAWRGAVRVYDRLTDDPATRSAKERDYARYGLPGMSSIEEALVASGLVLSLVTADQALATAEIAARFIPAGCLFCDMNSVAPATKHAAAAAIEAAGAHYVDLAIMAPVIPARLAVPLLLSGPHARAAENRLAQLGFRNVRVVGEEVGQASTIKMIRSVVMKGMEALSAECVLAAAAAGVTDQVLASLDASEKAASWPERMNYNLGRMMTHGLRRAEEMEEVVKTLEDLGVDPLMSRATARREREIGGLGIGTPEESLAGKIDQLRRDTAHAP